MPRVFGVLLAGLLAAAHAGEFSAWKDSTRIFINTSAAGANLTEWVGNFPLLVRLDSASASFDRMRSDGGDLRFADADGTPLPHEVESFDRAARKALVWVRVPVIDALSETDFIRMYWNNPAAASVSDGRAVFDTSFGYAGVWHLAEDGTGTPDIGVFKDATRNANHGDDFLDSPRRAGIVGYGHQFDGESDRIRVPNRASLQVRTALTFSAWVKGDNFLINGEDESRAHPILRKGDDNPNTFQFGVMDGQFFCSLDDNDRGGVKSRVRPQEGVWYHVAATWGPDRRLALYVNGELDIAGTTPTAGPLTADTRPLYIGGRTPSGVLDANDHWDGDIDEARIYRHAQSPQHIKLSYENQKPGSKVLAFKPFPPGIAHVPDDIAAWPRSRRLILNTTTTGADVAGPVERFPLLVRLDSANFDFTQSLSRGRDVRFTDPDGTLLDHHVERWDSAGRKGEIWVKVPKVDGGSRTDFVRMHWGVAGSPDFQDPAAVFDTDDGFVGVWHLNEGDTGRSASADYKDATRNANHGLDYVDAAATAAAVGKGQEFAGQVDYVQVPHNAGLDFDGAMTFSAWIRGNTWDLGDPDRVNPIVRKGDNNPNPYQFAVDDGHLAFFLNERDSEGVRGPTLLQEGRWYHVAAAWEAGTLRLYLDGALELETAKPRGLPLVLDQRAFYVGGRSVDPDNGPLDGFGGSIDEVQASRVARSADWIRLAFHSQSPTGRLVEHEGVARVDPVDTAKPADTVKPADPARRAWDHDVTLMPDQSWRIDSVLRVFNPGPGRVRVVTRPAGDTVAPGVAGVDAVVRVEAVPEGAALPAAELTVDTVFAGGRRLFLLIPGKGILARLSDQGPAAGAHVLLRDGEYILARDTSVPALRILSQGLDGSDSSWMEVVLEDNLDSLALLGGVSGAEDGTTFARREAAGVPFQLAFRPVPGLNPLKVSLLVTDGTAERTYPAWPAAAYTLPRGLPALSAPWAGRAGLDWGLYGLPVRPARPMTLEALAQASGAKTLYGAYWQADEADPSKGAYRILKAADTLPAGMGIWLAGERGFDSLPLETCVSFAPGDGLFRIPLRKGWNQITNPSLEPLPWPVAHADTVAHDLSPVKGLRAYGGQGEYLDADTLRPWQGYFVYSRVDTVVPLSPLGSAAKRGRRPQTGPLRVVLRPEMGADGMPGAAASLRLGAADYAADAPGLEDEPMPLTPRRPASLVSARNGRGLRTDLLAYRAGALHVWTLAWSGDLGAAGVGRLRVESVAVPEGMEVWAASSLRNEGRTLAAGSVVEVDGAGDTLIVWAAPAGSWREGDPVPGLGPRPERLGLSFTAERAGGELRLALPAAAVIEAAVYSADGRRLAGLRTGRLAPGYHALKVGKGAAWPRGLLFVTVDLYGQYGQDGWGGAESSRGRSRRVLRAIQP